jgi:hypothetical protein
VWITTLFHGEPTFATRTGDRWILQRAHDTVDEEIAETSGDLLDGALPNHGLREAAVVLNLHQP